MKLANLALSLGLALSLMAPTFSPSFVHAQDLQRLSSLKTEARSQIKADQPYASITGRFNWPQSLTCSAGAKTCKAMNSCLEAYFYMFECGGKARDRDLDGVPCECLCRVVDDDGKRCRQ